ncbi:hypothetical protein ACFV1N_46925 [Streptosporangium canum]|uniref:hypothetical protein n=1 Tax=Streptosporangium canum TaxID=324952 RepID=UPI0036983E76
MTRHSPLPEKLTWADVVDGDEFILPYSSNRAWRWRALGPARPLADRSGWVAIPIETRCSGKTFGPAWPTCFPAAEPIADSAIACTLIPAPTRRHS